MSNELEWNTIEQILKFVKYDHTKKDFCVKKGPKKDQSNF